MADDPFGNPEDPFKGTPFEGMFQIFGANQPGFGSMMSQMRQFMQPYDGVVNYDLARKTAKKAVTAHGLDPQPTSGQHNGMQDALQLADMWLDRVTDLPAAAHHAIAWTRAEWVENTMPAWQSLIDPVAIHAISSMNDAIPAEVKEMIGPLAAMLKQAGGAMFGQQLGTGLAHLSTEVLSSTDIGIPMGPEHTVALVPHNISILGQGLEASETDMLLYVTLRESAHLRLFAHATWLRAALMNAIEEFGRGMRINVESIEGRMQSLDPGNPEAIQEALAGGVFEPETTPEMQRARDRLELLLALIEGWVDEVVSQATAETMPTARALSEAMRRRRVTKGPAEDAFSSLVGLELRPRRLRDAATLWGALRDREGAAARDTIWGHPDLTPTSEDLDDPLGFGLKETEGMSDAAFDFALEQLFAEDAEQQSNEEGPEAGQDS